MCQEGCISRHRARSGGHFGRHVEGQVCRQCALIGSFWLTLGCIGPRG